VPLHSGERLGPYEITGLIGSGGMGEVYRARDPRIGREVAIKVLQKGLALDPDRLARFEQEARAAGGLNHPNLLVVFDLGVHLSSPYLVTELLDSVSSVTASRSARRLNGPRRRPKPRR
jgi:serine/threonine protein kinase